MQKENASEEYPYNLLWAIKGHSDRQIPDTFTDDHWAGLRYVLSTLDEREQGILVQRYDEKMPRSEIADGYDITAERVRQIETKACRKLQRVSNWNYIEFGIAGYARKLALREYNRGYSIGYQTGYQDGASDTTRGRSRPVASDEILNLPIEQLSLSTRAHNCMVAAQCKRIGDVVRLSEEQIVTMKSLGKVSANEIAQALKAQGVQHTAWDKYLL